MPDTNDNRRNETPLAKVGFALGQIIPFVFGIVFVAIGIFMLTHVRKNDNVVLLVIFSLIFCAFGLWTMFKAVTAGRRKKQTENKSLQQTAGGRKTMAYATGLGGGQNQIHIHHAGKIFPALVVCCIRAVRAGRLANSRKVART
jgi:hypothetical protein